MIRSCPRAFWRAPVAVLGLTLALAAGSASVGGSAAGATVAPVAQVDPTATTAPVETTTSTGPDATAGVDGDTGSGASAAQDQASEDLREVWVVVTALGIVAAGLLVTLVLYVWATNPRRAAGRLEARREKALRREARKLGVPPEELLAAAGAGATADDDADSEEGSEEGSEAGEPTVAMARPATIGVDGEPGASDADDDDAAAVDGDAEGEPAEGRVPAAAVAAVRPGPPSRGRRRDGEPPAAPASPRPAARPARPARPRRVTVPPKALATPDAERVLVRPGQTPVRVPSASTGTSEEVADPAGDEAAPARAPRPPVPRESAPARPPRVRDLEVPAGPTSDPSEQPAPAPADVADDDR